MTFEQLNLFRDIVQTRSVTRAAAQNGVSQSAASQTLQELEKVLEVQLVDRSTRPLAVTPAGRLFYEMCRDVLRRKAQFEADLQSVKGQAEGLVRVASIYSVGIYEMSALEEEFRRRCPQASISVDYLRPEKVYEAVQSDRADLGIVSYPEATREIAFIPWRQEEMVLGVKPSHPLSRRSSVAAQDLHGEDFIGFDEELPIRRHVDRFLREQGVQVHITLHFDNIQSLKEAIALGYGVSILPKRMMLADIAQGRLVAVPLQAELYRPLGIIHRRRRKFHPAAARFLELLQESAQVASEYSVTGTAGKSQVWSAG